MTRAEATEVVASMTARWSHKPLPDSAMAQLFADLKDLPLEQVLAGVECLYRDGREFPPNGAQIRQKVLELSLDAPDWAQVCRVVRQCLGHHPGADRSARLQQEHPAVVAFIEAIGWNEAQWAGSDERVAEAQVREKWLSFVRRVRRDAAYAGLPPSGLRALERVNSEPVGIADVLQRALPKGEA